MDIIMWWSDCAPACSRKRHAQEYVPAASYMFKAHKQPTPTGAHLQLCTYTKTVSASVPALAVTHSLDSRFYTIMTFAAVSHIALTEPAGRINWTNQQRDC